MSAISGNKIKENEDGNTQRAMEELDALYDKFQILFADAEISRPVFIGICILDSTLQDLKCSLLQSLKQKYIYYK